MATAAKEFKKKLSIDLDFSTHGEPLKYKVITDHTVQLTHELAYQFLQLPEFKGERQVNERHVQFLVDEWNNGRFIWEHVIIATATLDGVQYHINGQHTCWMRLYIPTNATAHVRWIDYTVTNEDALRALYGVFDRNKSRTPGHIVKALLAGTDTTDGIWDSIITKLAAGLKLWLWESHIDHRRISPNQVADKIKEYQNLFSLVAMFWQKNEIHEHLKRAPVFAALFATYDKIPSRAEEFWQPVADGLNINEVTDPRYRLREFLKASSLASSGGNKTVVNQESMYRVCINCWNKWRDGEAMKTTPRATDRRFKPR